MYWVAVSNYEDIIRYSVVHDSEELASQKAMIFAAREVYKHYAMKAPGFANKLDTLPCVLYTCADDDIDEIDIQQVQLIVRGEPERAISIECVNFRDITEC